mgnify:FL=1|tara:strand:- start:1379 stop:1582 length:204 start_codon:yes stop_codon:yes gene_type:complete
MKLIDTPNPNAKKIEISLNSDEILKNLNNVNGVSSVFVGPGFITVTKNENAEWELITQEIISIFDRL